MLNLIPIATVAALAAGSARPPRTDSLGAGLVRAALAELGGAERVGRHDRWLVVGRGRENSSAEVQGIRPFEPTWLDHEERVAVRMGATAVAWERHTPRNDGSVRWRRFVYADTWTGFVDWTTGAAARRDGVPAADGRRRFARRLPHLLLLDAAAGAARLTWTRERTLAGSRVDLVEAEWPGEPPVTLVLQRRPARLMGAEYRVRLPGRGEVTVAWSWTGWRPDPALGSVPEGHRIRVADVPFQEVRYLSYEVAAAAADSLIDVPDRHVMAAASADTVPAAGPPTGEVAPGIHILALGGFRVMLAVFRDFVTVVEAPEAHPGLETIPARGTEQAGTAARELREAVARLAPGKPIRFIVVSHHHSDHLGGVGGVARAGATVLAPSGDVAAVRAALGAPPPGSPPVPGPRTAVEAVARRRVVTDGERILEVWNVGSNPHTAENLFVWLPAERIAFQGDLFYYEDGGPFPPSGRGRMNRFFADWLDRHSMEPKAVYGVHSDGAAGSEALARRSGTLRRNRMAKVEDPPLSSRGVKRRGI